MVVSFHVVPQSCFQLAGAAVGAATELTFRQGCEPALNQIDPRGAGRSKVQMVARMTQQPTLNRRRLVGGIVVENQVNVQGRGGGRLDRVQKLAEFLGTMPTMTLTKDFAAGHLQSGKQRRGTVRS